MVKIINIAGVGERGFPDSMSDAEIETVLKQQFPAPKTDTQKAVESAAYGELRSEPEGGKPYTPPTKPTGFADPASKNEQELKRIKNNNPVGLPTNIDWQALTKLSPADFTKRREQFSKQVGGNEELLKKFDEIFASPYSDYEEGLVSHLLSVPTQMGQIQLDSLREAAAKISGNRKAEAAAKQSREVNQEAFKRNVLSPRAILPFLWKPTAEQEIAEKSKNFDWSAPTEPSTITETGEALREMNQTQAQQAKDIFDKLPAPLAEAANRYNRATLAMKDVASTPAAATAFMVTPDTLVGTDALRFGYKLRGLTIAPEFGNTAQKTLHLSEKGAERLRALQKAASAEEGLLPEQQLAKAEAAFREEAAADKTLIDRGGVAVFGKTIPHTPELFEAVKGKVNAFGVKTGLAHAYKLVDDAVRPMFVMRDNYVNQRSLEASADISKWTEGMSKDYDVTRITRAIDSGKVNDLDNITAINSAGQTERQLATELNEKQAAQRQLEVQSGFDVGERPNYMYIHVKPTKQNEVVLRTEKKNITRNVHEFDSRFKSISEAEAAGLEVTLDPFELYRLRMRNGAEAVAGAELKRGLAETYEAVKEGVQISEGPTRGTILNSAAHPSDILDVNKLPAEVRGALQELETPSVFATRGKVMAAVDKIEGAFRRGVTIYFPFFYTRNAASNVLLNFSDILTEAVNPETHRLAMSVLSREVRASSAKKFLDHFRSAERDFIEVGNGGIRFTADDINRLAKQYGVYTDFSAATSTEYGRYLDSVGVANFRRNIAGLNSSVENQARLVNFISNLKRGYSPYEAAQRTKFFMLDYSNMKTPFERKVVDRVIPFYSWLKGNTRASAEVLAKSPETLFAPLRFQTAVTEAQHPLDVERRKMTWTPNAVKIGKYIVDTPFPIKDLNRLSTLGWAHVLMNKVGVDIGQPKSDFVANNQAAQNLDPLLQLMGRIVGRGMGMSARSDLCPDLIAEFIHKNTPTSFQKAIGFEYKVPTHYNTGLKGDKGATVYRSKWDSVIAGIFRSTAATRAASTADIFTKGIDGELDWTEVISSVLGPAKVRQTDVPLEQEKWIDKTGQQFRGASDKMRNALKKTDTYKQTVEERWNKAFPNAIKK